MKEPTKPIISNTPYSRIGEHASRRRLPLYVAPTTSNDYNSIQPALRPIACWQLNAPGFALDSSFLAPAMREEILQFGTLMARYPTGLLSVFGHTDAMGDDEYNRWLGRRRAASVYGLLVRDTELWKTLYKETIAGTTDTWGIAHLKTILSVLSDAEGPLYIGPITAANDQKFSAAVARFRKKTGLPGSNSVDDALLVSLFREYMKWLTSADGENEALLLAPTRFLGGARADGRANYQGCGEFNPAVVMSSADVAQLSVAERMSLHAANRRALVYVFAEDTVINPNAWPCPAPRDGTAGCRKRFWRDAIRRLAPAPVRRTFDGTQDTFACRFYQRIATDSPCEAPSHAKTSLDLYLDERIDAQEAEARYCLEATDGSYSKTLTVSSAFTVAPRLFALRFTKVARSGSYSLYSVYNEDERIPIFVDVPFEELSGAAETSTGDD